MTERQEDIGSAKLIIERLGVYSNDDAAMIGRLLPFLSPRFSGEPVDEQVLREIIDSRHHEQLVARLDARIVGAATMSIVLGAGMSRLGYLEDFVVDPSVRGVGIGGALWAEITAWCKERGADLEFTSGHAKFNAHRFYEDRGAQKRDTNVFHWSRPDDVHSGE